MKKKNTATLATLWAQDGQIYIRTDYHEAFIKDFKELVPAQHRSWKPKPEKIWTCNPAYLDDLHRLCQRYFTEVTILEAEVGNGNSAVVDGMDPYRLLLSHCPDEYLKKIYRAIINAVHPDKGGSPGAAADVNTAWKAIRSERGLQ